MLPNGGYGAAVNFLNKLGIVTPKTNINKIAQETVTNKNAHGMTRGATSPSGKTGKDLPDLDYGAISLGALQYVGQLYDASQPRYTIEDFQNAAGTSYGFAGRGYQIYNNTNVNDVREEANNARNSNALSMAGTGATVGGTIGSVVGPVGTAIGTVGGAVVGGIGGLIAGNSAKNKEVERARQANIINNRLTGYERDMTITDTIQNNNAQMYGDYRNQYVVTAEQGLDQNGGGTWAYVDPLEAGSDAEGNAYSFINTGGIPGIDSVKMFIPSDYTVHSQMNGHAQTVNKEAMFQEYLKDKVESNKGQNKEVAEKVIQKELAESKQRVQYDQARQKQERDMGLLPEEGVSYAAAGIDNWLAGLMNVGIGLGQYFGAKGQKIKSPTTYFGNPYQIRALAQLNSLRTNPYPIMRQMREAEARGRYQIAQSGGLSGAQKYLANVAMTANTQNNIANNLAALQQQDNAYKAQAANAALQAGAQTAQNRMQSNQWDLDYYSKAHAARQQGMQMGLYNVSNAVQQFLANNNKLDMYNRMYNLYADDNEMNKYKLGIKSKYGKRNG